MSRPVVIEIAKPSTPRKSSKSKSTPTPPPPAAPASAPAPPLPDVSHLDRAAALARKLEVQALLAATRDQPAQREELLREDEALAKRLRDTRPAKNPQHPQRTPRYYAGLESALHDAIVARLAPELVAELEADAMVRLAEQWRLNAERKAAKGGEE